MMVDVSAVGTTARSGARVPKGGAEPNIRSRSPPSRGFATVVTRSYVNPTRPLVARPQPSIGPPASHDLCPFPRGPSALDSLPYEVASEFQHSRADGAGAGAFRSGGRGEPACLSVSAATRI